MCPCDYQNGSAAGIEVVQGKAETRSSSFIAIGNLTENLASLCQRAAGKISEE